MRAYPIEIKHIGDSRYAVKVATKEPDGSFDFEFRVVGNDIRVVQSSSEFVTFLRYNTGTAKDLMAAILALDMSQGFDVTRP